MADEVETLENLHLDGDVRNRAATVLDMENLRKKGADDAKKACKTLFVPGRLFGWNKVIGRVDNKFFKLYSKAEDIELDSPYLMHYIAGCEASMTAPAKHNRDNVLEIVIAKPRSVVIVACENPADAEELMSQLNAVAAEVDSVEGTPGNLTDEQQKALGDLKAALGETTRSDADLLRFLRAHNWEVETAKTFVTEDEKWRTDFNAEGLTIQHVANEMRTGKIRLLDSKDKQGRPIVVIQPGKHRPKQSTPLDVAKLLVYNMEKAIKRLEDPVDTVVCIVDLAEMSPSSADFRVPRLLLSTIQEHYPERISLLLVVNAPVFFRFVWATVRNFFSQSLLDKVHLLGTDMQTLQAFIPADHLLREHGGVVDFSMQAFIEERAKEEGVEVPPEGEASDINTGIDQSLLNTLKDLSVEDATEGAIQVGYLTKQGSVVKNWKKRYFVLSKSGLMYYYKSDDAKSPQGVILLERSALGDTEKENAFTIVTPTRTWILCAESAEDLEKWKASVSEVLSGL